MSQYIRFYLKNKSDLIRLYYYSENSSVYKYGNDYVPYNFGTLLSTECISYILNDIFESSNQNQILIEKQNQLKKEICQMNNSIEDKLEQISSIEEQIEELKGEKEELDFCYTFYHLLLTLVENHEIYAGVEWNPLKE